MAGLLVVLEGIDGSGKSTLSARLAQDISARGIPVVQTREPTDGPYGRRIRALAREGRANTSAEDELALFHADREAHMAEVVRPALAANAVVIQDRSYFSTIAYQGERGLDRAAIRRRSEQIAVKPDVLLVLDLPVDDALARIAASRSGGTDAFENAEALRRIRNVFRSFSEAVVIDARVGPDEVAAAAMAVIEPRLPPGP